MPKSNDFIDRVSIIIIHSHLKSTFDLLTPTQNITLAGDKYIIQNQSYVTEKDTDD